MKWDQLDNHFSFMNKEEFRNPFVRLGLLCTHSYASDNFNR